jgi:hypothetical protein
VPGCKQQAHSLAAMALVLGFKLQIGRRDDDDDDGNAKSAVLFCSKEGHQQQYKLVAQQATSSKRNFGCWKAANSPTTRGGVCPIAITYSTKK